MLWLLLLQVLAGSPFGGGGAAGGQNNLAQRTVTASTTITGSDDVIFVNGTAIDTPTMTLPTAASRSSRPLEVWNIGVSAVKVAPTGSENLNGGNNFEYIATWDSSRKYYSDGTQWWSRPSNFQSMDPHKGGWLYDDFQVLANTGSTTIQAVVSGTAAAITGGVIASLATMSTGTDTTGRASLHTGVNVGFMGTGGLY